MQYFVMLVIADITFNDSAYNWVVSSNPAHGEVCSIQHYISLSVIYSRSVVFFGYSVFLHL
jgi:hypothetical protein